MKKSKIHQATCLSSLKLLGDYWTLRIIDELQKSPMRFCELQRALGNLNPVTLTNRLKKLEEAEMLIRNEETIDKVSVSYELSELGQQSLPVLKALDKFSEKANLTR